MVLVYGAASVLGKAICRRLRDRGKQVRALLPRTTPAAARDSLQRLNVQLVVADLRELPAVAAACRGEQSVICADPALLPSPEWPPLGRDGVRCLVQFAWILGVHDFVYVTVPDRFETRCDLVDARDECCNRLEAHHMNYCVIQTGFFMDAWLKPKLGFHYLDGRATVFGEGSQQLAWVACDDVAEVAVRSLGVEHRRKRRIQVAAPETASPLEVIRHFEEARGASMEVTRISEAELRAQHKRSANPSDRVLAALKVEYARGFSLHPDDHEIPIPLTSVADFARTALGAQHAAAHRGGDPAD